MKKWFQARQLREQIFMAVFLTLAALTWLTGGVSRLRHGYDDWRAVRADLSAQQLWLDRRQEIETQSAVAVRNLDPARTLDATRLVATVATLAKAAELSPAIDPPLTQQASVFTHHQVKVSFSKASLPALLKFYDALVRQAPYLNLEQITVQADRADVRALSITLQLSAVQIGPPNR